MIECVNITAKIALPTGDSPSLGSDYIEAGGLKDSIVLCLETFDGGILKMPVKVKRQVPTPTGLFKQKIPGEHSQPVFHG